ncbi:hypothetical protein [Amycolatopsis decaplanina]|uniref:hypothetical protein n=1 Tax=Amycolatopsis decaplanina TaxID=208441 RepID=UPI00034A0D17|nr:hypothetical protein [Amycolatopsis decaplanina]
MNGTESESRRGIGRLSLRVRLHDGFVVAKALSQPRSWCGPSLLRKFAPLPRDNPRGTKLFVDTYSVFRAIRTLDPILAADHFPEPLREVATSPR